ncbi:FAD-dependent monooxygenase, partial [Sphingomonas sp.]|uniref:oxidoreductase n=1 Tax=Sphingomonas sp. TaxID=28214 RepID=UPI000DB5498E
MRVVCLGGGPAGLYFAISMKLRDPSHDILVVERNRAGDTFGWGVVFSDQTLENLRANDPTSARTIAASFAHWDDIEVVIGDRVERSGGHGFIGIGRKNLLTILQARARELGVRQEFETEFDQSLDAWKDYDLIVAADGINSCIRSAHEEQFGVQIETRANKFIWLGTPRLFDAFAFLFEKTDHGWIWAHAYRFDETRSTFIVECSEATWRALGFDHMEQAEAIAACEHIFARHLRGEPLLSNAAHLRGSAAWMNFRRILCENWSFDNVVLLGDAAHTAHFSIGSGTKLALEDAIKLADVMSRPAVAGRQSMSVALSEHQNERHTEVLKIQNSARNSTEWFETLERYVGFEPEQFAYSLLTRSQRVGHENLRMRDPAWLMSVERWYGAHAGREDEHVAPPMFTPFALRGMSLANRVAVSPVLTHMAGSDGTPTDFHLVHYGARALGGAGLVLTEMTAISADGRITPACPGLYNDAQAEAWRRISNFVHSNSDARFCVQLGHAGARGATEAGGAPDRALVKGGWPLVSASAQPYAPAGRMPSAMTRADMDRVCRDFVAATQRAIFAGFDMIELQAGHGCLLSSFLTPLMNLRSDDYGGSLEKRLRFPLEVLAAVRSCWGQDRPISVRISANDWVGETGVTPAEAVAIATALHDAGADVLPKALPVDVLPKALPVITGVRGWYGAPRGGVAQPAWQHRR